jgi:hypothetical protein
MRSETLFIWMLTTFTLAVPAGGAESRESWWSLQPVPRPAVPQLESDWGRTPVDAFVLAKLREQKLAPSPEADRRTLIRRLTFDLHGLPPTPAEVDAFVNDTRPDAYERLVDRLLESPRYGERWARHWLDVVHYGESHGYDKDKPRPNAWPYRDYVIRSLNADKPYSRFVEEQIAGDALYPDDPDGIVALGFIAAGPWDFVGHVELPETKTDGLIARYNDRDDMVSTVMSTFQSLTVHCARCHDHKFDPITQQDYYRLQAVFAGVDRAERPYDPDPEVHRLRHALSAEKTAIESKRKSIDDRIAKLTSPELKQLDQRLAELKRQHAALSQPAATSPTNGYHSAIMPKPDVEKWVQVDLGKPMPIDEIRLIPARPTDFPDTPGFGFPARFRVDVSDDASFATRRNVADYTTKSFPSPDDTPVGFRPAEAASSDAASQPSAVGSARFVRVTAMRLWERTKDYVFALAELQVLSGGQNVARGAAVTALDSIEAGRWSTKHLTDGFSSRRPLDAASDRSPEAKERIELENQIRQVATARERQLESLLDEETRRQRKELEQQLASVASRLEALPASALVYAATSDFKPQGSFRPPAGPRSVHLLKRGDVKQPDEVMPPGALACVPQLNFEFEISDPADEAARRAALAKWTTDPRNPLTRRSIVNRVWQYHFGRGIVDTPNDFGRMGSEPTHSELLDWLATWFLENGESLKTLHRLILMSSVYRQASGVRSQGSGVSGQDAEIENQKPPIANQLDSDNRFLWRMNRMRLDAESIRDATLFVSGKLDPTMGGPSDQHFFFKDDHSPVYDYARYEWDGRAMHRRSIYRFIVRSVPDPFMESFDCPDACQPTPKRNATLTALQALSLLNSPFMVRQAGQFAERVGKLSDDPVGRIDAAYRLAFGRSPAPEESQMLVAYAAEHGLANVCRLILNSNEFMFTD